MLDVLPFPGNEEVLRLLPRLVRVLAGDGPPIVPVPLDSGAEQIGMIGPFFAGGAPLDPRVALIVATSGSTGHPKGAMLSADALAASAAATRERLGGPGSWLLTLPAHHIAGLQVLLRGIADGTEPTVIDVRHGFDPAALVTAIDRMGAGRRYTSLIPAQLRKVLDHPAAAAAAADLDAILVGGGATSPDLVARALAAGLPIVRTYGMSETAGGCVYDGVALPGVTIRIDEPDASGAGRIALSGPMLALGYRNAPENEAFAESGWYRTDDLGALDGGVLRVLGRTDDAIGTGGLTVMPRVVEEAIDRIDGVTESAVVGLPDERLGQRVAAMIALSPGFEITAQAIGRTVADTLGRFAAPRSVLFVDRLPRLASGKPDRLAIIAAFPSD